MDQIGYTYRNLDLALGEYQEAELERFAVTCTLDGDSGPAEPSAIPEGLRERLSIFEPGNSPDQATLIDLGKQLSEALLPPGARARISEVRSGLEGTKRLRLRLRFGHPALATFPWEFAYLTPPDTPPGEEGLTGFLVLDPTLSMVRYEKLQGEAKTLDPIGTHLSAVCLFANPREAGTAPLDLEKERRKIEEAFSKQSIKPFSYLHATRDELLECVERLPHVFHYGGHGMFSGELHSDHTVTGKGFILLEDEEKGYFAFPSENLGISLKGAGTRLAVLTACEVARRDDYAAWSGVTPALVKYADIPAVLGMQHAVRDTSACAFSESFYRRIASGDPIDFAVTAGRIAVLNLLDGSSDWGSPVLYLRAEKGVLFPKTAVHGDDWETLRASAADQSKGALVDLEGDAGTLGRVIPEALVHRPAMEASLRTFLESDRRAAVVIGHSGVGKTNLLAGWTAGLIDEGHLVLFYDCRKRVGPDVRVEIARHLALGSPEGVADGLNRIGGLAPAGKRVVLVFDALNEFRGSDRDGPSQLLKGLDDLVDGIGSEAVRVVVTCATPSWRSIERDGSAELRWEHYYTEGSGRTLELGLFDDSELKEACGRYREVFEVKTDLGKLAEQKEELKLPLALRLLCETYRGQEVPEGTGFYLSLLAAYHRQFTRNSADANFLRLVAGRMLELSKTALTAAEYADLEGRESSLDYMVDSGALTLIFDPVSMQDLLSFTHTRFGAYVLASSLQGESPAQLDKSVRSLAGKIQQLPMAWDAARMALTMSADSSVIAVLARSRKPELWELAANALRDIFLEDRTKGILLLQSFLKSGEEDLETLGVRTLHRLGPRAAYIYRWAAANVDSVDVLLAVSYSLCLWYPERPKFPQKVFMSAVSDLKLRNLFNAKPLIAFLIDSTLTLYSNHCEKPGVADQIAEVWLALLKEKLHMQRLNYKSLAKQFTPLVSARLTNRILLSLSFPKEGEGEQEDPLFARPLAGREAFRNCIPLLQPKADIAGAEKHLIPLFDSPSGIETVLAGIVLAVHSCVDFEAARPVVQRVFDGVQPGSRTWVLLTFGVTFPDGEQVAQWLPFLEDLTRKTFEDNPDVLAGEGGSLGIERFDPILLPIGLAYGKTGKGPRCLEELLQSALDSGDPRRVAGMLRALGPVGFYYPEVALTLFRDLLPNKDRSVVEALKRPLSLMWTVHVDEVDRYMLAAGWSDEDQIAVRGLSNMGIVREYLLRLGMYNNAVHLTLHYPRMREHLAVRGMQIAAEARNPKEFLASYTPEILDFIKEADYDLRYWTTEG